MAGALTLIASSGLLFGGLLYFIFEILILVWIYNIALRKGRHPIGWFILGLFFTIFALILILLLPSKKVTNQS